mgnify:CR=1 FL=1
MKKGTISLSLPAIKKSFFAFLHRYHVVLFVVIVLGSLGAVILLLNNSIIASTESNDYTPQTTSTTFDEATMKRIEELKTRDQNTDLTIPAGRRSNPFVE